MRGQGLCHCPEPCLVLGTLRRLCLELLLCREEGRQSVLTLSLTLCSAGQKGCSPCFFTSPSAFLFFRFNCLSTSLAPSHATVLPAALEGNEAFAAKSDPCLFPSPPMLGLAYVCSAEGAGARFSWVCFLLLSLCCCRYRLTACLAFELGAGLP